MKEINRKKYTLSSPPFDRGFSLIELLLVITIVGILAAVAVPSLMHSRNAAENAAAVGMMRTLHGNQTVFMASKGRYARLPELNTFFNGTLGTTSGETIRRGPFTYLMSPSVPTIPSLQTQYTAYGLKYVEGIPVSGFLIREDGVIVSLTF